MECGGGRRQEGESSMDGRVFKTRARVKGEDNRMLERDGAGMYAPSLAFLH